MSIHRLTDDLEVPPYIIELMKDHPLHPSAYAEAPSKDARRLDTSRLALQISHMLSQLRQRITPSQLGLGEETSTRVITLLLEHLARPWSQSASLRRFRRFATEGTALVAVGFDAMYFCVTGKEFTQPDTAATYSRGEFEELFTFRDRVEPGQALNIKPLINYPVDEWSVINHSAAGFRLGGVAPGSASSMGSWIVVRPHDGEHFLLAEATRLMQEQSGGWWSAWLPCPACRAVSARVANEGEATRSAMYVPSCCRLSRLLAKRPRSSSR